MKEITQYFVSHNIDPFLAGLVIGAVLCAIARLRINATIASGNRLSTIRQTPPLEQTPDPAPSSTFFTKTVSINIGGNPLSAEASASVMAALDKGDKIGAIKLMREATQLGLKEAKELVEAIEKGRS